MIKYQKRMKVFPFTIPFCPVFVLNLEFTLSVFFFIFSSYHTLLLFFLTMFHIRNSCEFFDRYAQNIVQKLVEFPEFCSFWDHLYLSSTSMSFCDGRITNMNGLIIWGILIYLKWWSGNIISNKLIKYKIKFPSSKTLVLSLPYFML